jgi:hypothetical protein
MRVVSCDELTTIQALERDAPTQPMQPRQMERLSALGEQRVDAAVCNMALMMGQCRGKA